MCIKVQKRRGVWIFLEEIISGNIIVDASYIYILGFPCSGESLIEVLLGSPHDMFFVIISTSKFLTDMFSLLFQHLRSSNQYSLSISLSLSSLLYIETADRPGLLLEIYKIITDTNIDVESAEIDTEVYWTLFYRVSILCYLDPALSWYMLGKCEKCSVMLCVNLQFWGNVECKIQNL